MKKYFMAFIFCFAIFVVHLLYSGHGIYGDGNGYYSYTQALYFDEGLNFAPIFNHLEHFQGPKGEFSRIFWNTTPRGPKGILFNPYMIGTGIVWVPSMAFISLINVMLNLHASRFALIYELGPGLSGIILMLGGLYFLGKYLKNFFTEKTVFWTIAILFFGSYFLYYASFEPALSHEPSFFIISFLLYWTYKFKPTKLNLFLIGILSGLLATVRLADTILLIPIYYQIWQAKPRLQYLFLTVFGGLIGITPQLYTQYLIFGNFLTNYYLLPHGFNWAIKGSRFFGYLFSPIRGFFVWSPVFLIGLWGIIQKKKWIFLASIFLLWLVSSSNSSYLSAGFGQRYSFSTIPYFAFGIAFIIQKYIKKPWFALIPFFVWNLILLYVFYILRLTRSI